MAAVARECDVPLATNMVVTDFAEFRRNADMGCPVKIVLSDHHYWGGLRATQRLSTLCRTFDLGLSMHSNSHLGVSLVAMRSEEHTSELQSQSNLVCRLLLEKKK